MFVTASDFNLPPYKLPSFTTAEGETFDAFVDQEEEKYLREVLGPNLYTAFTEGLEDLPGDYSPTVATVIGQLYVYGNDIWEALTVTTGVTPVEGSDWTINEADNRWLLLKNGNSYLINDKRYYWQGMVKTCKALIYSKWVEYGSSALTSNGFVIPKMENNLWVSPNQAICNSWNDWARNVGSACEQFNTLYGYIYNTNLEDGTFDDTFDETFDSFNDYLNFWFTPQERKNMFDI